MENLVREASASEYRNESYQLLLPTGEKDLFIITGESPVSIPNN